MAEDGKGGKSLCIFRGQSQSGYLLEPSALREPGSTQLRMLSAAIDDGQTELWERTPKETGIMSKDRIYNRMDQAMRLFYTMAGRIGLDLPSEMTEGSLFSDKVCHFFTGAAVDDTTFGPYMKLQAIAQHYRFPTFLLDWSLDPLCAMYFAVQGSMSELARGNKKYLLNSGRFSIWCLKADRFIDDDSKLKIYSYNHYNNRNQVAQRGVFTYVVRDSLEDMRTALDVVDGLGQGPDAAEGCEDVFDDPVILKFSVPYRDIIDAMDYLKLRFKTSDTFFPGYEGVVMAMKDHSNYQIVKERIEKELRTPSEPSRVIPGS